MIIIRQKRPLSELSIKIRASPSTIYCVTGGVMDKEAEFVVQGYHIQPRINSDENHIADFFQRTNKIPI
jgi:hypothetical protein